MIKINLLPVRAAKKKETAVQQIAIFVIVILLVAGVVLSLYLVKRAQCASTAKDIATANKIIGELKLKIGKLEELKALKAQVKKKLDVLAQLRKNKTGPAQRLSTLSDKTPDKLWLTGYSETGSDIKISGVAFTEELIAEYMRVLESSPDFMSVELVVSEQIAIAENKLKKFDLTMKIRPQSVPAASSQSPQPATTSAK